MTVPPVTDLSPGTALVAGSTGWRYTVTTERPAANKVVLRGPRGPLTVPRDELLTNIADGKIEVSG